MPTFSIELSGTITRDIIWLECDAADEEEVKQICAREHPYYRVRSIIPASGRSDGTTPAAAGGTTDEKTTRLSPRHAPSAGSRRKP